MELQNSALFRALTGWILYLQRLFVFLNCLCNFAWLFFCYFICFGSTPSMLLNLKQRRELSTNLKLLLAQYSMLSFVTAYFQLDVSRSEVIPCMCLRFPRASGYPQAYDGGCLQMRLSYCPAAHFLLFLVQWTDCRLAGTLGLLRILIYKVNKCFPNSLHVFCCPSLHTTFWIFSCHTHRSM